MYNSNLVVAQPIVQATLQTDNAGPLPSSLTAQLTWNGGTPQNAVTFGTAGFHPGDQLTFAVQDMMPVMTTGRYGWSVTLTIPGHANAIATGVAYIRAEDASAFGAGWTLSNVNRLVPITADANGPAGQLWLYGTGEVRFFAGTTGTLTGPPEDNGTLVANTGGTFTYTGADGTKIDFNAAGYQTDWRSADGLTALQFTYGGSNQLLTETAIDGQGSTFTYSGSLITAITAGQRTWTLSDSGTDLASIGDPAGTEGFAYANHKMTSDTFGALANVWTYASSGLAATVRWGNASSPSVSTLTSANSIGLTNLGAGAANGGVTTWVRDGAGRVTSVTDPMGRLTQYQRDSAGYVTIERIYDRLRDKVRHQEKPDHPRHTTSSDNQSVDASSGSEACGRDKHKHVDGRKRHIIVDSLGLLLAAVVTAANVDDAAAAPAALAQLAKQPLSKRRLVYADNKYHNHALYGWVEEHGSYQLEIGAGRRGSRAG